ncbi:unnamed protein product [Rotaria sp. Silwood1]|nr:unnamed protein product [Rotaria sp. Silwood1]
MMVDKIKKIDHHESLPFHKKSTNQSQIQHQLSSNSYHYDDKSDNSSNRSSSRDSMRLAIHHKHKHNSFYNHHTTTSFNTPSSTSLSSHTLNSTDTKQIESFDKAAKHYHQTKTDSVELSLHDAEISSTNNQHQISCLQNEMEPNKHLTIDNHQVSSSKDFNKSNMSSSNDQIRLNTNSISKNIRINHYPNMLADFD